MISVRVFVIVILAVKGLNHVRAGQHAWTSPINFVYKDSDKFLNTSLILLNIPPPSGAFRYALYGVGPAGKSAIPVNGLIPINKLLNEESVTLDIQLLIGDKICTSKRIMYGKHENRVDNNLFRAECLSNVGEPCHINVDFEKKCQGNSLTNKMQCTVQGRYLTCETPDEEWGEDAVHQWYQRYDSGYIGILPPVTGGKSNFTINLRKFDHNTIIFKTINAKRLNLNVTTEEIRIQLPENGRHYKYTDIHDRTYSDSELVNFTCPNFAYAQIGWIDPTGYTITTYHATSYSWKLSKSNNGSMLCCLLYNTYKLEHTWFVERLVEDITVLIYQEPGNQNNAKDNGSSEESTSSSIATNTMTARTTTDGIIQNKNITGHLPQPVTTGRPVTFQPTVTHQTPLENSQTLNKTEPLNDPDNPQNTNQLTGSPHPSDKTNYYIAIASVAVIILVISLIYVIVKKCSRKRLDPEEALELETYASANMVYAELDIGPGNHEPAPTAVDTTYAEIIGVLKPMNETDRK